jgi:hypothetical protein
MLNRNYFVFFMVVTATFFFLAGCSSFSGSQSQDPEKKAFEVAHDACGLFRRMGIEQVNNSNAVLETWGESTSSKVWVVQLTGTLQSVDTPVPTIKTSDIPNSSASPAAWLIVCEVSIDADDWHVIGTRQTRTKINP